MVAAGLGLPALEPTIAMTVEIPSHALSQLGTTWPTDGRLVGILVPDALAELSSFREIRDAIFAAGMVPLVIASAGGALSDGAGGLVAVQRTFLTARSIEFDTILLAGAPGAAVDAIPAVDAKAVAPVGGPVDPRFALLLSEAYRHGKAIGGWGDALVALQAAGVPEPTPGVVIGDEPTAVLSEVLELLGQHRVWDRFPG